MGQKSFIAPPSEIIKDIHILKVYPHTSPYISLPHLLYFIWFSIKTRYWYLPYVVLTIYLYKMWSFKTSIRIFSYSPILNLLGFKWFWYWPNTNVLSILIFIWYMVTNKPCHNITEWNSNGIILILMTVILN